MDPSERDGLFLGHLRSLVPYFGKQFLSIFYPHVVLGMCHSSLSLAQLGRLSAGSGRDDQGFSRPLDVLDEVSERIVNRKHRWSRGTPKAVPCWFWICFRVSILSAFLVLDMFHVLFAG